MSDIMELIVEYKDVFCDYVISGKRYAEARECYVMLESRISAMQEVCDAVGRWNYLKISDRDLMIKYREYERVIA